MEEARGTIEVWSAALVPAGDSALALGLSALQLRTSKCLAPPSHPPHPRQANPAYVTVFPPQTR